MSLYYQCQRCTACCRIPGFVRITEAEVTAIATQLGLGEADFIERFTRLTPQRTGLALIDKPDGECFFLENGGCLLQAAKPAQCVGFPNTWNYPGWQKTCQAIPIETIP
jgi:Fe-S-cluster containining protein